MRSYVWVLFVISMGFGVSVHFQNCAPINFEAAQPSVEKSDLSLCEDCEDVILGNAACAFNGQTIFHGQEVEAYLNSTGATCSSEKRMCNNGSLSGSFSYSSCTPTPGTPQSCLFNGSTILHGQDVTAYVSGSGDCRFEKRRCNDGHLSGSYQFSACTPNAPCLLGSLTISHGSAISAFLNPSVPYGQTCQQQFRVCTNGMLSGSYTHQSCSVGPANNCQFNGNTVSHGQSVKAYLNTNVEYGKTCSSEDRTCNNGALSGTFAHASCVVDGPKACSFNGTTVPHGQNVTAFQNSTVPFGSTCVSQTRSCTDGVLSGSYTSGSCVVDGAASCTFNGQTIVHGQNVTAYQNSTVPFGESCVAQSRVCVNGALSGSFNYASCAPNSPQSCLFDNRTITHGDSVTAFVQSSVPYGQSCQSEVRSCTNGILSGMAQFGSCTVGQPASCLFNGQTRAHGSVIKAYKTSSVPYGSTCESEDRSCNNGALSGSYLHASCNVNAPQSCIFNGASVAHGEVVKAYTTSTVPYGQTCQPVDRTCNNGVLSGSGSYASCQVNAPQSCLFNGNTIPHGGSTIAYTIDSVEFGQTCTPQTRTCNNGTLNGQGTFSTCTVKSAKNCSLSGKTIVHGTAITAFQTTSVPFGSTCASESRVCNNGSLSGSFVNLACSPVAPLNCSFGGQTVLHGKTVSAYQAASVPFGNQCAVQTRSCSNGVLSGTYTNPACSVNAAKSCSLAGKTIAHGGSITAFQAASVPFGSTCSSQSRVCSNGTLSGSYVNLACSPAAPLNCSFAGQTVLHGKTVSAYQAASVPFGTQCVGQTRSCSNGVLSGTYANPSCSVQAPKSCSLGGRTIAHGASITAFQAATVPYGSTCASQNRVCSNGSLSGSYAQLACAVQAPIVRWVNSRFGETHKQTCSRAGLYPSVDRGNGICASGEARPSQHLDFNKISYIYGTWGDDGGKGSGGFIVGSDGYYTCYRPGQKRDNDATDRVVAFLCSQVVNNVDTTPPLLPPTTYTPPDGP